MLGRRRGTGRRQREGEAEKGKETGGEEWAKLGMHTGTLVFTAHRLGAFVSNLIGQEHTPNIWMNAYGVRAQRMCVSCPSLSVSSFMSR